MDCVIFSENRNIIRLFDKIEKSTAWSVSQAGHRELKKRLDAAEDAALWYLDAAMFTGKELLAALARAAAKRTIITGVIDARGVITDTAELFRNGAGDFLGPKLCKSPIAEKRLLAVIAWKGYPNSRQSDAQSRTGKKQGRGTKKAGSKGASGNPPALKDWKTLESGSEYTFTMMYIELDGYRNLGQRVHEAAVEKLLTAFQRIVGQYAAPGSGRVWMWNDFGGIVLFPYGDKPESVIIPCMRLMLSRRLISVEQSGQRLLLSYRIVLYPGSTVYHERGKTGRIISDAVNSLSHIGQKFSKPGNMYITQDLYAACRPSVRECFRDAGTYEKTVLYRMRLPAKY